MVPKGKKVLNVHLPKELYEMYAKLCIDLGISKTDGIIQYMEYLNAQPWHKRKGTVLNEGKQSNFKLISRNVR